MLGKVKRISIFLFQFFNSRGKVIAKTSKSRYRSIARINVASRIGSYFLKVIFEFFHFLRLRIKVKIKLLAAIFFLRF